MNSFLSFLIRLILWLFLIVFLLGLSFFLLDLFGIYKARDYLPLYIRALVFKEDDQPLEYTNISLDEIRMIKEKEAIYIKNQQVEKLREELKKREDNLNKFEAELNQKQKDLDLKQKVIDDIVNKYKDEDANFAQAALYLVNMPPEDAVKRLEELNDEIAISYMRKVEDIAKKEGRASIVPYWLSLMDSKKAAVLIRKMSVSSLE
ncbi:periplasmic-type flagellar collar protein FlbB [Borrelia miyamotoi]|uniref:Flagellar protein n=1 Tax=Borrelia miyamotoi TaxID=47466 RepID=A0AAQ2WWW4_9SPIR|nr:flagellar protein [Borrelia miyamotoi]AGT27283.1 flagellar protein [Borrelia miyamotoi LB-2001]AJA58466.1 flagellar protein [Borrelia miyamotoi]AOW95544.1 flagellar protein [Borrelia miyamotoi]QTL83428.1 flagellar protein [Borrelia miyamotoi]WAZ85278.1 flagellar protein [Borrelia miyamotoi]